MKIRLFQPHALLEPHLSLIWAFESPDGIPDHDAKLIAPNGCMKLLVPYRKRVVSHILGNRNDHAEMSCIVAGQMRQPVRIDAEPGGGTIGFEFKPASARLFFQIGLHELTDGVHGGLEVWGQAGTRLVERLGQIDSLEAKVAYLQHFLCQRLQDRYEDPIASYAVRRIIRSSGFLPISELSDDTGYSRQHLTRTFTASVGLSPKQFARIVRFQQVYDRINAGADASIPLDIYDHYYDQSHFVKEFQAFTGVTPGEYMKLRNEFGKLFYREKDVPFLQ